MKKSFFLVREAKLKIEELYEAMTARTILNSDDESKEDNMQRDILEHFKTRDQEYGLPLKENHLTEDLWDLCCYLTRTQERRDFRYKLLKRVIKDTLPTLPTPGRDKISKIYKEV